MRLLPDCVTDQEFGGQVLDRLVGQPFKLSRTPSKIAARPPNIGEHTDEILKEFGFADQEIAALHEAKAV